MNAESRRIKNYLIIAGVYKAATTSLFAYLSLHPSVCSTIQKEISYFTKLWRNHEAFSLDDYTKHFEVCERGKYYLDASPSYFYCGIEVAKSIQKHLGSQTKVIIMLREPVSRFISHFNHNKKFLALSKDARIEDFINEWQENHSQRKFDFFSIEGGFYAEYLEQWFDVFDDNLKIIFFDDIKKDRNTVLVNLANWLEIEEDTYQFDEMYIENRTIAYKSALLQKIGLKINKIGRRLWYRHPFIKRNLKFFYYYFNGAENVTILPPDYDRFLRETYRSSNNKVHQILELRGYKNLPDWLKTN
jgi:hypothetical protein